MPDPRPWKVLRERRVADCRVFAVTALDARREGVDGEHTFYRVDSVDWVQVVALTAADEVVLVRQWRHGAGAPVLEVPSGMVDPGEDPADAARRELAEETGYRAARWRSLGSVNPNPALFRNRLHTFVAEGCAPAGGQETDPHEEIAVELVPRAAIPDLLRGGRIDHALARASLYRWLLG